VPRSGRRRSRLVVRKAGPAIRIFVGRLFPADGPDAFADGNLHRLLSTGSPEARSTCRKWCSASPMPGRRSSSGSPPDPSRSYRHKALHDFYDWEVKEVLPEIKSAPGLIWNALKKTDQRMAVLCGPGADRAARVPSANCEARPADDAAAACRDVALIALALPAWFYAHYAAPIAGLLFVMIVQGLRHLRVWRRRQVERDCCWRGQSRRSVLAMIVVLLAPTAGRYGSRRRGL